jgi:D-alanine-D-alanine ligase-like ATP-grasp enzyme
VFGHEDKVELDRNRRNGSLRFPFTVKPVAEDGSLGIGAGSVVHTIDALRDRVAYVTGRYRQMALVEQFVTGREVSVALWGDPVQVLPLSEFDYGAFDDSYQCVVSYKTKWQED